MSSEALTFWKNDGRARLDELVAVHVKAAGEGRGRKWGTEQLNRSLFVALVAQFQGYCVALHDLSVSVHVAQATSNQGPVLRKLMTQDRKLDKQNPRTGALGSDFSKLGLTLIPDLKAVSEATTTSLEQLDILVEFRNAIAHGNETEITELGADHGIKATKSAFSTHRKSLDGLVATMDRVVPDKLGALLGIEPPW